MLLDVLSSCRSIAANALAHRAAARRKFFGAGARRNAVERVDQRPGWLRAIFNSSMADISHENVRMLNAES